MSWTEIDKPTQGDATRKSLADAIIDNLDFLFSQISGLIGIAVPNSSFEQARAADGIPNQWTWSNFTGGTLEASGSGLPDTNCIHGRRAAKIVNPGGGSNGGGTLTTSDFLECTPNRAVLLSFQHYSTVASIRNKVEILFYDASQAYLSTTTIYTSVANPTVWTAIVGTANPPATARYLKIRLTGGDPNFIAGSAYFDDIRIYTAELTRQTVIEGVVSPVTSNVTLHYWTAPVGVYLADFELFGAGGRGGQSSNTFNNGGGGGGGGYSRATLPVTPGTQYAITLAGSNTTAANSTVVIGATTLLCGGGGPGGSAAGAHGVAGAGGTASGGTINTSGSSGGAGAGLGYGGLNASIGVSTGVNGTGVVGLDGSPGTCAGGSGCDGNNIGTVLGGAGATSRLIIRY